MLPCRERCSGVLSEAAVNTSLRRCPKSTVRFVNENQSESVRGRSPLVVISQTSALRKLRLMERKELNLAGGSAEDTEVLLIISV